MTRPPSYWTALDRVRTARGTAGAHNCAECSARAATCWSYDGTDPDELTSPQGYRYSLNADRYRARCRPCHRRLTDRRRSDLDTALVARLYAAGATARAIARLLGTSHDAIYDALRTADIPIRTTHDKHSNDNKTPTRRDQLSPFSNTDHDQEPQQYDTPTPRHPDPMARPSGPRTGHRERTDRAC
jgi:hypothetical protein